MTTDLHPIDHYQAQLLKARAKGDRDAERALLSQMWQHIAELSDDTVATSFGQVSQEAQELSEYFEDVRHA